MSRKVASLLAVIALSAPLALGCTASAHIGSAPAEPTPPPAPAQPDPPPAAKKAEPAPAPTAVKPRTDVKQKGNKVEIPEPVKFAFGKADLDPESEPVLTQLRDFLKAKPAISLLRIEGHTDNVGQPAANLKLSGERALAVRDWLINNGIESKRLISVGFGDLKPVAPNTTDEGRAQNRRTEFIIVELAGKPMLGADPIGGGTVFGENPRK